MRDTDTTKLQKLYEDITSNYRYFGNCSDSFDPDTGDCEFGYFSDVSDFARYAELSEDDIELADREGNGEMDKDDFYSLVSIDSVPDNLLKSEDLKYYYYSNGLLVIYDLSTDMHYFFGK